MSDEDRGAEISEDGVYRYLLWRRWDKTKPRALFIMLNPSTADADVDDPTIRRCIGFAKSWGMGGIRVTNLYPFRATDPADLARAAAPRGQGNLNWIERSIDPVGISIAAWGAHKMVAGQASEVRGIFYDAGIPLYALKLTADGHPGHPLYIASSAVPLLFEPARNKLPVGTPWIPRALPSQDHPA
jgi:hypothetical protein